MTEPKKPLFTTRLDESLLTPLAPFARMERAQIREVLDLAQSRRYSNNSTVFEQAHEADRFFLLLDGYVRVMQVTPAGEQIIVLHIPPGQMFGIARALGRETYPATAMAAAESIVLSWPTRLWDEFVAKYPGFGPETSKTVGKRVGEMNTRIVELATQQVEQRIANALLRLVNQAGRRVEEGIEIDFPISRQDLSEMTGTTLHSVSRLLSAWEKQGLVKSGRKRIIVREAHQLVLLTSQ